MISRQGIDFGFNVGEVLQEQRCHVRVKTPAVGHRRTGEGRGRRALDRASTGHLRQLPHDHAVTEIPGNPWQLTGAIGESCNEARDWASHGVAQPLWALPSQSIWAGKGNDPLWSLPARSCDGPFRTTIQLAWRSRFTPR